MNTPHHIHTHAKDIHAYTQCGQWRSFQHDYGVSRVFRVLHRCIHTCTHTYTRMNTHIHMLKTYMHTHTHAKTYMHTHTHAKTYMHTCSVEGDDLFETTTVYHECFAYFIDLFKTYKPFLARIHRGYQVCMCLCMYVYIYIYIYIYVCMYVCTCTHKHTHAEYSISLLNIYMHIHKYAHK